MREKFKELQIEDYIWYIYIFLSILAIISNKLERRYYLYHVYQDQKKYKYINTTIFTIAIIIYLYFLSLDIKDKHKDLNHYLHLFAATLFFIGGIIYLYLEVKSSDNEEIGFS